MSNEDNLADLEKVENRLISSVYKNQSLTKILGTYPNTIIELDISPSEKIKRTWILDAAFIYPLTGMMPITPWWGTTNLSSVLTVKIGSQHIAKFDFSATEKFEIISYPYYRAGKILTKKYALAYDKIFKDIRGYNFCERLPDACKGLKLQDDITESITSIGSSDVDVNIPPCAAEHPYRYALIIGNEDYSSYQSGLTTEIDVIFAENDATIFKDYANKTMGIPEKNITLLINATSVQMRQAIAKLNIIAEKANGKAELYFYYAGHGLPDEVTKEPYLIPVDVNGANVQYGIKLTYLYNKLTEFPTDRIVVFLDACFSGGARSQGLLAARGVRIKPREEQVNGKMAVFSASSGDQSSLPYNEKMHGIFTYYLLKKLQESSGDITYEELYYYIKNQVGLESIIINSKEQDPQINISPSAVSVWKTWQVN